MSLKVARAGDVILELETLDELRAEVSAGRVLPTDHFHMPGMSGWQLVSALPKPSLVAANTESAAAPDADSLIALRRAQILDLIRRPANPKPDCCRSCGTSTLKSSKLVWQQGTRVGGAIDTNLDVTVFGSSSLQGLDLSPPAEPSVPGDLSGSFLSMVVSGLILIMVPGILNILVITFMFAVGIELGKLNPGVPGRLLFAAYFIGIIYLGVVTARRFYRWDAQRGLLKVCEVELARAQAYLHWRNTWVCTSCGQKTIAR